MGMVLELDARLILKSPWNWDEKTIAWATAKASADEANKASKGDSRGANDCTWPAQTEGHNSVIGR